MENAAINTFSIMSKRLLSKISFRRLLVYTLITSGAFYYGDFDASIFNPDNSIDFFKDYSFLRFVSISLVIYLMFYVVTEFLLRLLFHGYLKDLLLKSRKELKKQNPFTYLRDMHFLYSFFKVIFKNCFYRLGFIEKSDLEGEGIISEAEKEELLNEVLADYYKWICTIFHFILTLIFVWQYHGVLIISLLIVVLLFAMLLPIGAIILIMNIDLLLKVRLDILKSKNI